MNLFSLKFLLTKHELQNFKAVIYSSDMPFVQKEMYKRKIKEAEKAELARNAKHKIASLAANIPLFNNDKSIIECLDEIESNIQLLRSAINDTSNNYNETL